jgi:GNAT superfamily N-acetyltransferase
VELIVLPGAKARENTRLSRLLARYRFGADAWPGCKARAAAKQAMEDIPQESRVVALDDAGEWTWAAALTNLGFDTELFGLPMGRISHLCHAAAWPEDQALEQGSRLLAALVEQARDMGLDFLSIRLPSRDMLSALACQDAGFRLMDTSVDWQVELDGIGAELPHPAGYAIRKAGPGDQDRLAALAADAFCNLDAYADRFAMDPRLRKGCGELYRRWTQNSLSGQAADVVLVLESKTEPVGFITLTKPAASGPEAGMGWVVLNAISPECRGMGLYHLLLQKGMAWLLNRRATHMRVRTKISQLAVIRGFSRLGGRQVYSANTFHMWLDQI